jgi:hypothetical protein
VEAISLHANVRKPRLEIPSQTPKISAYQKACGMSDRSTLALKRRFLLQIAGSSENPKPVLSPTYLDLGRVETFCF